MTVREGQRERDESVETREMSVTVEDGNEQRRERRRHA